MKFTFSRLSTPKSGVLAITATEGGELGSFGRAVDEETGGHISRAIKAAQFEAKLEKLLDIVAPHGLGVSRVVVAGLGKPGELTLADIDSVGGAIAGSASDAKVQDLHIAVDSHDGLYIAAGDLAAHLALGAGLRAYVFDRYKTMKEDNGGLKLGRINVLTGAARQARSAFAPCEAVIAGVHLARDLVNEPANVLYPEEFANRCRALTKLGVKVEVLTPKEMEKLGMRALLAVGQGSARPPRLVVMTWQGRGRNDKPVAFIGKGVTFDTGGISLKPGAGMGDMKGDMAGAACVTGLMHALAARKAKVNAVGVIGIVENMPDAAAQRPGDIVTSMSGQTIEVLNTDAEGRLVLADALWYTQDRFKPQFMINLATLTGAILVALGKEYAGAFSNNDELCSRLIAAGLATGDKVWRMPLAKAYDKLIDTPNADMKNIGGRDAGSITAAQFLQRFVNDVPWVHIDIAGTAMNSPKTAINQSWGSGYGVRLLDRLVADHYEG